MQKKVPETQQRQKEVVKTQAKEVEKEEAKYPDQGVQTTNGSIANKHISRLHTTTCTGMGRWPEVVHKNMLKPGHFVSRGTKDAL